MNNTEIILKNPIDDGWYADPEARIYEGMYVIYATCSLPFDEQKNQVCFTSYDLVTWKKHENIIDMSTFPWATRAIWAPTIIDKDGKYYYIFASGDIHSEETKGGLEIAVSDSPTGPFRAFTDGPLVNGFHNGAQPIDAHLFKDDDGTVYLLYGGWGHCNIAVMNDEMNGFVPFPDGEIFKEITPPDYVEGPCVFKRRGEYYFMWSAGDWGAGTYRVNVAHAKSLLGDFSNYKTILETGESDFANGPGHNGYIYLPEQDRYLIVYHRHHNSVRRGNARFICIDDMPFDENGEILTIRMTKEWKITL